MGGLGVYSLSLHSENIRCMSSTAALQTSVHGLASSGHPPRPECWGTQCAHLFEYSQDQPLQRQGFPGSLSLPKRVVACPCSRIAGTRAQTCCPALAPCHWQCCLICKIGLITSTSWVTVRPTQLRVQEDLLAQCLVCYKSVCGGYYGQANILPPQYRVSLKG